MKCIFCGYDPKEQIGHALEDIKKNKTGSICLNQNGRMMLWHRKYCLKNLKGGECENDKNKFKDSRLGGKGR